MIRPALISLAVCALFIGPSQLAWADDDEKGDHDKKPGKKEPIGPIQVDVPPSLRGQGYALRIGEDDFRLDGDKVQVTDSERRENIELVQDGRIHAGKFGYVDKDVFEDLSPRDWRVGLFVGGTSINGDAFKKILLDDDLSESTFSAAYQPSRLGYELQIASLRSEKEHDYDVEATYESSQTRLNVIYELTPWSNGSRFVRHVHLIARGGLFAADHALTIEDDAVTLEDESTSTGILAGIDALYNWRSVFFGLRYYVSYQKIEFAAFDMQTKAVSRSFQFGGDYAF